MSDNISSFTAQQIADKVGAVVHGDAQLLIKGLAPLDAPQPHTITFIRAKSKLAVERAIAGLLDSVAALVDPAMLPADLSGAKCTILSVSDPNRVFVDLIPLFFPEKPSTPGIHPSCVIDPSATIGRNVSMGPQCVIGANVSLGDDVVLDGHVHIYRDVTVGARSRLYSGVAIRESSRIGTNVIIHNNSVIGSDGFGYLQDPKVGLRKVPQVGTVEVGDYVEIGANTTIDRGAVGSTIIGPHTKIDNQVQIGHNVVLGSHCVVCAKVGIAGSCKVGSGVVFGGGVGVADHVTIVSGVRLSGYSGVYSDILEPGDYMGVPAIKAGTYRRQQAIISRMTKGKGSKAKD